MPFSLAITEKAKRLMFSCHSIQIFPLLSLLPLYGMKLSRMSCDLCAGTLEVRIFVRILKHR